MSIRDEMMSGRLYDASNGELLDELLRTQEMCQDYNALRITDLEGRTALLHKLIGKVGKNFIVNPPFFCDYGSNIEVGDNVFINAYCVILDEAKVTIGNNVFIAPQCGFYTAGHPLDKDLRRRKLEYSLPIGHWRRVRRRQRHPGRRPRGRKPLPRHPPDHPGGPGPVYPVVYSFFSQRMESGPSLKRRSRTERFGVKPKRSANT